MHDCINPMGNGALLELAGSLSYPSSSYQCSTVYL